MSQVTIFEINSIQTEGRLVYPPQGRNLTREEIEKVVSQARVAVQRCGDRVEVRLLTGNYTHRLLPAPPDVLLEKVSKIVTKWFPREKGEVVVLIERPS